MMKNHRRSMAKIMAMAAAVSLLTGICSADIWDDVSQNFWDSRDGYLLQWIYLGGDQPAEPKTGAVSGFSDSRRTVEVSKSGQPGAICWRTYSKDQGPGHYLAVYRLQVNDNALNDAVARLDVSNNEGVVIAKPLEINGTDFKERDKFQEFTVDFEIPPGVSSNMEYRVHWTGKCDLQVDTIKIFQREDEMVMPANDKEKVRLKLDGKPVIFYASFDSGFNPDYAAGYNRGVPRRGLGYVPGKKGQAISLTSGSCYYAGEGNINPSRGTMMVWVKTTVPADELATDAIIQAKDLLLYYHPRVKAFGLFIPQGTEFYSAGVDGNMWPADTWHHVAVTWNKTGGRGFYIDGVRSSAADMPSGMESCTVFSIGKGDDCSWHYFQGVLDEMYIFDGALSADEIKTIYERQNTSEKEIGDL